jgi:flagellar basal body-associated protein FliL
MAEEPAGPAAPDNAKKLNKLVIRLLIVSVVIMIATPLVTISAFVAMSKQVVESNEELPPVTEVALPRIQINVAGTNATRYAQVEVVVAVSDPSMLRLFHKQSPDSPDGHEREIVASVIEVIGDKPLDALLTTEGKQALANEIKATINDLLADYTAGMVTDVYFCGFLIQ